MQLKKIMMLLMFVLASLVTVHTASASAQFADIPTKHEAYKEIEFLVNKKVISGYTEGGKKYFKPNNSVTRGQAAKMVVNATGKTTLQVQTSSFEDIQAGTELSGYAERALALNWFQYTSDKKFSPNMTVSRQEMAKIIAKANNLDPKAYEDLDLPFEDVSKSSIYYGYIAAVYYNGIARGQSATKFGMTTAVTRSQFSLFVARATSTTYRLDLPVQGIGAPDAAKALGQVKINTNDLNIRSTDDFTSATNKVGKANKDDVFSYYEVTATAYKINYNGEYAYVYKTYADIVKETTTTPKEPVVEQPTTTTSTLVGIATVNDLAVRATASGTGKKLGSISRGTTVPVLSITGNWAKVTYNGKTAYISKTYLRLKNKTGSAVKGRIIVLDAGHGGGDGGASYGGAKEKDVVLSTTLKLKKLLEAKGAVVYLTRSNDTFKELPERVDYAKAKNAEIFISIHANAAAATSANGTETFYSVSNNLNQLEDKVLAQYINEEIVDNLDMRDRGVKQADYYVIKNLTMPAVLVELGFISNPSDREKLVNDKKQDLFAESIFNGIMRYYAR